MKITTICDPLYSLLFNLPYHNQILRKSEKYMHLRITREPIFIWVSSELLHRDRGDLCQTVWAYYGLSICEALVTAKPNASGTRYKAQITGFEVSQKKKVESIEDRQRDSKNDPQNDWPVEEFCD